MLSRLVWQWLDSRNPVKDSAGRLLQLSENRCRADEISHTTAMSVVLVTANRDRCS